MVKIIAQFEIPYYQYLGEAGELLDTSASISQNFEALLNVYRYMVLTRTLDTKAVALQRTGKLGTYPSTRGQEAVFVGVGHAMAKKDILVPYYRDMGTLIQRGVKLSDILLYWGGDERGNVTESSHHDFPFSVPVGSQPLHAVGAAFALKYKKQPYAVVSMCGDGATSQGDFYEAINVAGIWQLPVVFVVCNNQWAISVPRDAQTAATTLAQKAIAAGILGEQIDGNDAIAVCERMNIALQRARDEHKPSVLEMVCYRQHDHTTADDASRYEPKHRREQEWHKEPVGRLRRYLEQQEVWSAEKEAGLQTECAAEVDRGVADYLAIPPQSPYTMFDYLYATLPAAYAEQRAMLSEKETTTHG